MVKNMEKLEFTFLTEEQVEELDILKKYGTAAAITDFAILLGGYVSTYFRTSEGNRLEDSTGLWWTKTQHSPDAIAVDMIGYSEDCYSVCNRLVGGAQL